MDYSEFGVVLVALTVFAGFLVTSDLVRFTYVYYKAGFTLLEAFRKALTDLFGGVD